MSGAYWSGDHQFLGRVIIGRIEPRLDPSPSGSDPVAGVSYLPGNLTFIGRFTDPTTARKMVEKSADSRIKTMIGVDMKQADQTAGQSRALRKVGRAIFRAGVWTCDRPTFAFEMFRDLAWALELDHDSAPKPKPGVSVVNNQGQSSAWPTPEDVDLVE